MAKKLSEAGEWKSDEAVERVNRWTARGVVLDSDSCLMRSQTDEPVFVLCARDPHAVHLVDVWCQLRRAEIKSLEDRARRVVSLASGAALAQGADVEGLRALREKIADAQSVAAAMERWRSENGFK